MSREKQIEEIAEVLCGHVDTEHCKACDHHKRCFVKLEAEWIYGAGYRKQEWISVDERLPEESIDVLVALDFGDRVSVDTDRIYRGKWFAYGEMRGIRYVTHWMPFPEAPEGGAE
jgi:hypothetical protein